MQMRKLKAPDIFPMSVIINKIGVNELAQISDVTNLAKMVQGIREENGEANDEEVNDVFIVNIALKCASVICKNLTKCEKEIFKLLADVTETDVDTIRALDFDVFLELLVEFFKKEELRSFFKVASTLSK